MVVILLTRQLVATVVHNSGVVVEQKALVIVMTKLVYKDKLVEHMVLVAVLVDTTVMEHLVMGVLEKMV